MSENLETLDELILRALGALIWVTDRLTAIGFGIAFVVLLVAGAWMLIRGIVVRFRRPGATDGE